MSHDTSSSSSGSFMDKVKDAGQSVINKLTGNTDTGADGTTGGVSSSSGVQGSSSSRTSSGVVDADLGDVQVRTSAGVSVRSKVETTGDTTVNQVNTQKLDDLLKKLGSTSSDIDVYSKSQTAQISADAKQQIDAVLERTKKNQEDLVRAANAYIAQIDAEYKLQLQAMVEQVDATKAATVAKVEAELNTKQQQILQNAKSEIDAVNKSAAAAKVGVLQDAAAKVSSDAEALTSQAIQPTTTGRSSTQQTTITTKTESASTAVSDQPAGSTHVSASSTHGADSHSSSSHQH